MRDFMKWTPFIFAAVFVMVLVIKSDDIFPDVPEVIEPRPQGSYTLSGMYSDGFVFDETGNVWEYYTDDIPGVSSETETPVVINFHGFGTPELEDDVILGLSYGILTEAYCSSAWTDPENGQVCYQFKTLSNEYFWVLTADELGFSPVIGDQVLMCYTENGTPDNVYDDEFIYARVL